MEEVNDLLGINNLKIVQNKNAFKFSLDSVILSHFVTIHFKTKKILDIGTGNAPIPLILSTKTKAKIVGVEIQKESVELAKKSVNINKLESQINIILGDIRELYKNIESDVFDVIVCNPPFFKLKESSILNNEKSKVIARHEMVLTLNDIFKVSKKILKNNGNIALVHRPDRLIDIIKQMKKNNIEPKKLQFVYPYVGKNCNMILIEGTKNGKPGLKILEPLYIYNKNSEYTDALKQYMR